MNMNMKLSAGSTLGTLTGVEADQVDDRLLGAATKENVADLTSAGSEMVPGHLHKLYNAAEGSCHRLEVSRKLAGLIPKYCTVFYWEWRCRSYSTGGVQHSCNERNTTVSAWAGERSKRRLISGGLVVERTNRREMLEALRWYLSRKKDGQWRLRIDYR